MILFHFLNFPCRSSTQHKKNSFHFNWMVFFFFIHISPKAPIYLNFLVQNGHLFYFRHFSSSLIETWFYFSIFFLLLIEVEWAFEHLWLSKRKGRDWEAVVDLSTIKVVSKVTNYEGKLSCDFNSFLVISL